MEWLNNLTSGENGPAINLVLITLAIVILLAVVVWIFKKMTGTAARRAMRSRVPRLSITDSTTVDEKRYLVMVRRDNVEHLLLIGGANDLVVESNIVRAQSATKPQANVTNTKDIVANNEAEIEQSIVEEQPSLAAPIAGATAIGAAGLAAVTSTASSAASTVAETTSDNIDAVVDTTSNIAETVSSTASEASSSVIEQASDTVDNLIDTVSLDLSPEDLIPDTIEIPEPAVEAPSEPMAETDLESTISAQLDDALSADAEDIKVTVEPIVTADSDGDSDNRGDDEMQRLLDELSGEAKEPAQ